MSCTVIGLAFLLVMVGHVLVMPAVLTHPVGLTEPDSVQRCLSLLALGSGAGLLVGGLGSFVRTGKGDAFDPALLVGVRRLTGDVGPIVAFAKGITALGNDVTLWAVTLLAAGYLVTDRGRRAAAYLAITAASGGVLTGSLKWLASRPRPALVPHLVEVHSASFPSGHAMNATFVYGTLALIAARRSSIRTGRSYIAAATMLLVLLIGTSRVVLGVHWPSDVLAGWTGGALWALIAARVVGPFIATGPGGRVGPPGRPRSD